MSGYATNHPGERLRNFEGQFPAGSVLSGDLKTSQPQR
jgi:hypothetical protein